MPPKFAVDIHASLDPLLEATINFNSTGLNTVIAGVSGTIIRIYKIFFVVGATTNVTYQDGANALTGALNFSSNEGMILDFDTRAWFTMSNGNSFNLNQSGTAQISGRVHYTQDNA